MVDFNEEFSALTQEIITNQVRFTRICIDIIRTLYGASFTPLILIGNSMGGFVVRNVFLQPNFDPNIVRTVITVGTPHQFPVLILDDQLYRQYELVNQFWQAEWHYKLRHLNMISIGGGERDFLVWDGYTDISFIDRSHFPSPRIMWTTAPSIAGQWFSVDHDIIMECRQFVRHLCTAIYTITTNAFLKAPHRNAVERIMDLFRRNLDHSSTSRPTVTSGSIMHVTKNSHSVKIENKASESKDQTIEIGPVDLTSRYSGIYISVEGILCSGWLFVGPLEQ